MPDDNVLLLLTNMRDEMLRNHDSVMGTLNTLTQKVEDNETKVNTVSKRVDRIYNRVWGVLIGVHGSAVAVWTLVKQLPIKFH